MADLGRRIKELKDLKKLTSQQLSTLSGVPLGTLNKVLSSSTKSVKTETLKKIADALSVSVSYLMGEKKETVKRRAQNFGYVRTCAVTPKLHLGHVSKNAEEIKNIITDLSAKRVNLIVFPELSLCGYTLGDLLSHELLLKQCEKYLVSIADFTRNYDCLIFVGVPLEKDGKVYNCAVAVCKGEIIGVVPKTRIPSYDEFGEKRTFAPAPKDNSTICICGNEYPFGAKLLFENRDMPDFKVGVDICEDMWFVKSPSENHAVNGATIIVNLSASNELIGKAERRKKILAIQSYKCCAGYVYANAGMGESSTDLLFSGHNLIAENGQIIAESEIFTENTTIADIDVSYLRFVRRKKFNYDEDSSVGYQTVKFSAFVYGGLGNRVYSKYPFIPEDEKQRSQDYETALNIQAYALVRRMEQIYSKKVVIGLSGGLDSTLAILVACRAYDIMKISRQNIIAITMPCFGTTERTKSNAVLLAEELGVTLKEINISDSVKQHFKDIGHDESVADVTYENAQARERTQVLMDVANSYGGIVLGTGDMSELALGWATYNGDHMSMYGVNCSIPKTLVRELTRYEASKSSGRIASILFDILDTPVSPELLPTDGEKMNQKTEDLVGPYSLHDFFLYHFISSGFAPSKIYKIAVKTFENEFDSETVYKWLETFIKRFFAQQFKRSCVPDGIKVCGNSLSPRGDWRMPSDANRETWLEDLASVKNK